MQKQKGINLIKKKACKQPAPKERKPIKTSNPFSVLDRDALEAGPSSTDTPREPQRDKRMPPLVAKFQVVATEEIKMLQDCTKNEINFEYVRGGLKIRTFGAADHKAVISKLKEGGIEYFTFNPNPGQSAKFILKGPPPNMTCEEVSAASRSKE